MVLSAGKPGTEIETACGDAAVALSIALQHGASLDTLRRAMARLDDGGPAGPAGKVLDMIAELA